MSNVMVGGVPWIPAVQKCEPGICYTQSECQEKGAAAQDPALRDLVSAVSVSKIFSK